MTAYTIDTAAAVERMVSSGMPENQARAVVDTISQSQEEIDTGFDLATTVTNLKVFILKTVIGTSAGLFFALKASEYLGI